MTSKKKNHLQIVCVKRNKNVCQTTFLLFVLLTGVRNRFYQLRNDGIQRHNNKNNLLKNIA
jgi:hypothetical protein